MKLCALFSVSLAAMLGFPVQAQQAPRLLPFQGRLTDQNGVAVGNGVRLVQFKVFEVPTGGSPVWAGELHRTTVNGGLVNVLLGSKTPFTGVDFDRQLYLEITLDINGDSAITAADPPMLPRQAVLPVLFAKESENTRLLGGYNWSVLFGTNNPVDGGIQGTKIAVESITSQQIASGAVTEPKVAPGIFVPVGSVLMWWGSIVNIPQNFELCDGSAPTTPGATLAGSKPDLRDRFPKGALSDASDVKSIPVTGGSHTIAQRVSGATILTLAQMPRHNHTVTDPGHSHTVTGSDVGFPGFLSGDPGVTFGTTTSSPAFTGVSLTPSGNDQPHDHTIPSHDNRPAFLEMFFIIRVK